MRKTLLMSAAALGVALLVSPVMAQTGGTSGMGGTSGAGMPDTSPATRMGDQGMSDRGMPDRSMADRGMADQGMVKPGSRAHGRAMQPHSGMTSTGARPGHEPGEGVSEPLSTRASNIDRANTRSDIAPRLPTPRVGENAGPEAYVRDAQRALRQNRTGEAQEALERAETRVLEMHQADQGRIPMMDTLEQARQALGHHDVAGARRILDQAMAQNGAGSGAPGAGAGYSSGGPMGGAAMGSSGMGRPMAAPGGMAPDRMGSDRMAPDRMAPAGASSGGSAGTGMSR